ncbi:Alpha/Beta hydrolase protein, partial [Paraphysoderma sedebokerense]
FFWYFPPKEESTTGSQPLIIWLQGGPGSSSLIGLFSELDPYQILSNLTLERRPISWNRRYHLLFIDQPVGTGFSYTGQKYMRGIPANEKAVAIDLLVFLKQFYSVFPELKTSELYVTGESYAGKYVPWFSSAIIEYNDFWRSRSQLNELIPLAGMGIGDGLTDPITQIKYHADLALNFGLTTYEQSRQISRLASLAIHQVKSGQYIKASQTREELFRYFDVVSGGINVYDIRKLSNQNSWDLIEKFAKLKTVKGALNVDSKADSGIDEWDYCEEVMKSAAFLFPRILNLGYKVLLYQAQFDFKDGTVGSTEWISNLKWEGRKQYNSANRTIYHLNNNTVGYITSTSSSSSKYHLTRVELLNAGHLAPSDQPEVCFDMLRKFIDGQ